MLALESGGPADNAPSSSHPSELKPERGVPCVRSVLLWKQKLVTCPPLLKLIPARLRSRSRSSSLLCESNTYRLSSLDTEVRNCSRSGTHRYASRPVRIAPHRSQLAPHKQPVSEKTDWNMCLMCCSSSIIGGVWRVFDEMLSRRLLNLFTGENFELSDWDPRRPPGALVGTIIK